MNINRNNYGAFFLDYWENNLDRQGREELAAFLEQYPELQDEFFDFQSLIDAKLPDDRKIEFTAKHSLRKTEVQPVAMINQNNYETYIIASLEGDLSEDEQEQFKEFCRINPAVASEIGYFRNTFLRPEAAISYAEKNALKKGLLINLAPAGRWAAAAAIILLLAGAYFFFGQLNRPPAEMELTFEKPAMPQIREMMLAKEQSLTPDITEEAVSKSDEASQTFHRPAGKPATEIAQLPAEKASESVAHIPVLPAIEGIHPIDDLFVMQNHPVEKTDLSVRTEVSDAFGFMLIRDAMEVDIAEDEKEKSLVGKVLANLFNKALGLDGESEAESSLLAEVTRKGRETVSEVSGGVPFFKRTEENGQLKTIFGINENFNIRRSTPARQEDDSRKLMQ